jgi:FkbM family methyltransferase
MTDYIVSYAQNREDIILNGFFKDIEKGFYVDVGANHPTVDSVTKMFYEHGWRGINVEPNQRLYKLLKQDRPEDINLNVGVSSRAGKLTLREYPVGHGLSTFSKDMQKEYLEHPSTVTKDYKDYEVDVVTLRDIFKKYDVKTINFVKIDVEGYEYEVIVGNDWDKYRPQVVCIEANHIIKDWRPLLKQANYLFTFFDGLNEYYVAKEHPHIREQFSYVDSILLDKPIVQVYFHDKIQGLHNAQKQTERKLIHQELMNQSMTSELHALAAQQMQYQLQHKRIRVLIKQLGQATNAAILLQIEKLNKPKIKKQERLVLAPSQSPTALLTELKDYDLRSYYEARSAEPISYKLISGVYNILYRVVKTALFGFAKLLRKAKNGK